MSDAPSPATISGLIAQEHLAMKAARTVECRLFHARRLVQLRFERGDYSGVLQVMGADLLEAMARALVATQPTNIEEKG
jgi:hypothetical protein